MGQSQYGEKECEKDGCCVREDYTGPPQQWYSQEGLEEKTEISNEIENSNM